MALAEAQWNHLVVGLQVPGAAAPRAPWFLICGMGGYENDKEVPEISRWNIVDA